MRRSKFELKADPDEWIFAPQNETIVGMEMRTDLSASLSIYEMNLAISLSRSIDL